MMKAFKVTLGILLALVVFQAVIIGIYFAWLNRPRPEIQIKQLRTIEECRNMEYSHLREIERDGTWMAPGTRSTVDCGAK